MTREIREPSSLTSIAFNTGVIAERRRIIKLLETNTPNNYGLTTLLMNWVVAEGADPTVQDCADFANEIIALIKGENTDKAIVHTSMDNSITDTQEENK